MFIDQATIFLYAGKGGNGCVGFRREKYVPKGGPNGGDGGKGGSIIFRASFHLHTLMDFRYKSHYKAESGDHGKGGMKNGKDGEDLILEVPCGTQIINTEDDSVIVDLVKSGDEFIVVKGGKGGRGNTWFSTPSNRTPRYAQTGQPGEEREIRLDLKLIADVGLVGLPNVGKSTLISRISKAKPKIADYAFTTLIPNLGVVKYKNYTSFTVADIPGLIEGASQGKGLGIQFLQHIERTKILVFLLDAFSDDIKDDFKVLLNELKTFDPKLAKKPRFITITKIDAISKDRLNEIKKIKVDRKFPMLISSHTGENLDSLLELLHNKIKELNNEEITIENQ